MEFPRMTRSTKLVLTVALGVVGIAFSTLYFANQDGFTAPFWAEIAKWVPGILISVLAYVAAENSKDEARTGRETSERAELEARTGRETAERAEGEARSGRERAERAEQAANASGWQKHKARRAVKKAAKAA